VATISLTRGVVEVLDIGEHCAFFSPAHLKAEPGT